MSAGGATDAPAAPGEAGRLAAVASLVRGPLVERMGVVGAARSEALLAGFVSLVVGFGLYGVHVARGGFTLDDWLYSSLRANGGGFVDTVRALDDTPVTGGRSLAAFYFAVEHSVFGGHPALHLAWAIVVASAAATAVFLLLRALGLTRPEATVVAVLALLFPASDSTRLWPAAAQGLFTLTVFLAGVLLALTAFRSRGRRALALHAASLACYAVSLVEYEIAIAGVALAGLLYLVRFRGSAVGTRWLLDIGVAVAAVAYVDATTTKSVAGLSRQTERVREIEGGARTLLAHGGIADGAHTVPLPLVAAVVVAAVAAAFLLSPANVFRPLLRRSLVLLGAGIVVTAAAYVSFVGTSDSFYVPTRLGIGNRTNLAAAVGYAIVLPALIAVGVTLVLALVRAGGLGAPVRVAHAVVLAGVVVLAVAWVAADVRSARNWDRAAVLARRTVAAVDATVPKPPAGTTVVAFGVPTETAPLVPVFFASWDLTGALGALWRDDSVFGIPAASAEKGIHCGDRAVEPRGFQWDSYPGARYGRTIFVDVSKRAAVAVGSAAACRSALARMTR